MDHYQVEHNVLDCGTIDIFSVSIMLELRNIPDLYVMPPGGINFTRFRPLALNVSVNW
jgi:hypothetical protein